MSFAPPLAVAWIRAYTHGFDPRSLLERLMDLKDRLPLELRAAYLALHRCSDMEFAKFGVTADQFVLLATLARGDALTQRELAARMPSDPSTVRAMLVLLGSDVERRTSRLPARAAA